MKDPAPGSVGPRFLAECRRVPFAAGYLYGLLKDRDVADCLKYGTALGASCVGATGATTGIFSEDELQSFVESQELSLEHLE